VAVVTKRYKSANSDKPERRPPWEACVNEVRSLANNEVWHLERKPNMKIAPKFLLAVALAAGLNACAIVPAGPFHGGGVVIAPPRPVIYAPAPVLVGPGWGWGGRWSGGYRHHHHHGHRY
jgi:hypothetical protein